MALFRFHRGNLKESIATTNIVKDRQDLIVKIIEDWLPFISNLGKKWPIFVKISPYPDEKSNFDARIGWYTHLVLSNINDKEKFTPVGFLSEPL